MCLITYIPQGVAIPWDALEEGGLSNDDGHGFALADGRDLIVRKSFDLAQTLGELEALSDDHPHATILFHSRLATHGTPSLSNLHPFTVKEGTVLVHNGIMPQQFLPQKGDSRSDTGVFAARMAPHLNHSGLPSRRTAAKVASIIGHYNKVAFLSVATGKPKVRILNSEEGVWDSGCWFSNTSYIKPTWAAAYRPLGSTWNTWDKGPLLLLNRAHEECLWGGSYDSITFHRYCTECLTCQDCGERVAECLCYTPAVTK